ncbi:MAG: TetR/AcrR family transcriptional regulator [Desulfovibrio sp.]
MTKTKIGRPRSEKSQEAIIAATHKLLNEFGGAGLSIEKIAKEAKVGKPTIYRWWPSLADIVLDALLGQAKSKIKIPTHDSFEKNLNFFLQQSIKAILDGAGPHLQFLMAQAQINDEFRERFRDNFVSKRREVLSSLLKQYKQKEQTASETKVNIETLVDIIFGSMWYRLLVGHAPLDQSFADELTQLALNSMSISTPTQNEQ